MVDVIYDRALQTTNSLGRGRLHLFLTLKIFFSTGASTGLGKSNSSVLVNSLNLARKEENCIK